MKNKTINSILVTGSEGYIGSHLKKIVKCDTFDLKQNQDIRTLNRILKYDTVIHLAALVRVGESIKRPIDYYETNVFGTLNLLRHIKTKHFIFASTGAAEKPTSPYALSKLAAEQIVVEYCTKYQIPFTIFRFYNVIGCDKDIALTNEDGLFYGLKQACNTGIFKLYGTDYNTIDGTAIRDYVHVYEICQSIKSCIDKPSNKIESLGHGEGYSVKQIVDTFKVSNNVDFKMVNCGRRDGDLEVSVLKNISTYMKRLYNIKEMLKLQ